MALGDTTVEVIMKNISNRKMRSVMDAMLKVGDILALRFNTGVSVYRVLSIGGLVQQVHERHGFGLHLVDHTVHQCH